MNMSLTLLGGQAFNWDEVCPNVFVGFFTNMVVKIDYRYTRPALDTSNEMISDNWLDEYIPSLNIDIENIPNMDSHIRNAIYKTKDITILKQPFEQTVLSYILATNKNIPAIRSSIRLLSELLGDKVTFENKTYHLFPTSTSISHAEISKLKMSKIGYRASYLKESAKKLTNEKLGDYNNQENIRNWLMSFPGIGPKVADCILVYSLGYKDVIPLDVWMQKIFQERYELPYSYKYEDIRKWYKERWGDYSAIVGQYLFEAYRK